MALDALDEVMQNPVGNPNFGQEGQVEADGPIGDNIPNRDRPGGTSAANQKVSATPVRNHDADSILSRLKRDDPGMARRVLAGELSANAAAITNTEPPLPVMGGGGSSCPRTSW